MKESYLTIFDDVNKAKSVYRIDKNTLAPLRDFADDAQDLIPHFLEEMTEWIHTDKVFLPLYANDKALQVFQANQKKYWTDFFAANIDKQYLNSRLEMGRYYVHINLPISAYCGLISYRLSWWLNAVNNSKRLNAAVKTKTTEAIQKVVLLDTGATCAAFAEGSKKVIEAQSSTLIKLSTPTIELWEGILLLPIVGVLDSYRAQNMTDNLFTHVVQKSAPISIIDIIGVSNVDSSVANHLIKIVKAAKLLGNTCVLSGISPEVAQTLIEVGVELDNIHTTSTLKQAFKFGLKFLGLTITEE